MPTPAEVAAIIVEAAKAPGFKGARNRAFFTLLYETGSRANALRGLAGDDVFVLPSGRVRLMVHQKGGAARREVEMSDRAAALLREYVAAFNHGAAVAGRGVRIELGWPGPVWRSSWRGQWAYANVAETFARACQAAGTRAYTLHALRRAFATEAASTLPRHEVARAGGWRGLERLDDHYIRPRESVILGKLSNLPSDDRQAPNYDHAAPTL